MGVGKGCGSNGRGTAGRSLGSPGRSDTGRGRPHCLLIPEGSARLQALGAGLLVSSTRPSGRQSGRPKPDPRNSAWLGSYHGEDGGGFTRASRSTGAGVRGRGAPAAPDQLPPCQEPLPLCLLPRWRPRATSPTGNGAGQRAEGGAPWGGECAGTRLLGRFCRGGVGALSIAVGLHVVVLSLSVITFV